MRLSRAPWRPSTIDRPSVQFRVSLFRLGAGGERLDMIDSTGLEMHRDRRVIARRQGARATAVDLRPGYVWGARWSSSGPTALLRCSTSLSAGRAADEDSRRGLLHVQGGRRSGVAPAPRSWKHLVRPPRGGLARTRRDWRLDTNIFGRNSLGPPHSRWIKQVSWRNHLIDTVEERRSRQYIRSLPWIVRREVLSLFMTLVDPRRLVVLRDFASAAPAALRKRRSRRPANSRRRFTGPAGK